MQRQYSNVSYQEYQPSRKYGPQYEPGGFAAAVQQRTNMTQREDALKFEQGRIKALQEERLHIQKKTFTKWVNSFLQKARMEVDDLFEDLADGRRLLKLLEIISSERLPRPNSGRMRVHKIENVNKSLSFLHTKVRLESIGAEDIVDGNPRLILGLIWTIILRFQIQEIEIDVDEENVSSEKKSAKDALLLWCQRKTSGYHGVHIHNFTDSWRSGLGFNALIHAHRPDLFRWHELPTRDHVETLNHAFDVAHNNLGIPRLLDAEDVDTTRPDEKSVMTYVASYYHTFARMKNEQKSGRRIANIIGQLMECDGRKAEYSRLVTALLEWIRLKIEQLNDRQLPNSLDAIQRLLLAFKQYRTMEKPPKYIERSEIEALYFDINTMQKSLVGEAWAPLDGQLPQDLERAWQKLEQAEHARELALRTELLRQQRLEQLNYKFNTKSVLRKGYLKEMIQVLSDPRYGSNLAQVDATVKKHEAISADILARTERFEDLSAMAAELIRENYHGAEAVTATEAAILSRWRSLLELLERHRASLAGLARLTGLLRDTDAASQTVTDMKTQFQSEEVGRHLVDVERLLQAHALQELQLGALHDTIRRLARQGPAAQGPQAVVAQLNEQLTTLEEDYQELVAAAKDRKARLEDARNLYQFLEDHDEEEGWVTDKQKICRADIAAKDIRGVLALRHKHTALLHEARAREHVSQRHRDRGHSLIEAGHPKSAEIAARLESLSQQWAVLRQLAAARDTMLANAAEAHQFYGDANEAESWMKEKRPLVATDDVGRDSAAATALLARHKQLHDEIHAYRAEIDGLGSHAEKHKLAGITTLQLPTEVEPSSAIEDEELVQETRLVPTEVWEQELVERLEHRTVTEERSVPQVKALYAFTGQGISMQKGEVLFLINKTNPDWWSVRKADRSDGFVPANYVREIEPRLVPVQVRRPEKVRSVQRVKKTVLVKQVVQVRRPPVSGRRASRALQSTRQVVPVEERMAQIQQQYDELTKLSAARREQLEDAIKLFSYFDECDDFDKWMKEKERMLRSEEAEDSVVNAKRKYEKFVTDLSAASKRMERIEHAAEELSAWGQGQGVKAAHRRQQVRQQWDNLLRLKQHKEKSLEGANTVEVFSRTCMEACEWMWEKEQQLSALAPAADLRTVRALQRRHHALERELEPLRDKVATVRLLATDVKSQYPSETANVEARQKEVNALWEQCQAQAADRRQRLESAVGHEIFRNTTSDLQDWLQKVDEQLAQEVSAKDVATAEALHKQHQELLDDIKAHRDEFVEVIGLGKQLLANNPSLADVADKIKDLETQQQAVEDKWKEKDSYLKQVVQLQAFNREADRIDASSGAHEAYLEYNQCGTSVEEVEALLKRHEEELEARLVAQDERLTAFQQQASQLQTHYAAQHIKSRAEGVAARRSRVKSAAAARRRELLAALAHHQLLEAADELRNWIHDKTRTATDQSYRDLANLERKLQKHEAFERELQANEKQLRNVETSASQLQKTDPGRAEEVSRRVEELQTAWAGLLAASRDKGSKLRQAALQRKHRRSVEDAKARLLDLERALRSEELGTDVRSCKRLLIQHQALEQELTQWEQKAAELSAKGADLVSGGHFDAKSITEQGEALQQRVKDLQALAEVRKQALSGSAQLQKFALEVSAELDWLSARRPADSRAPAADLHAAQTQHKKHNKLRAELRARAPVVQAVVQRGLNILQPDNEEKIKSLINELETTYAEVTEAADSRAQFLEQALKTQQFHHDALEVETWLNDKAATLTSADVGTDRHRATSLLTRHKAVELELDTYAAIITEMGHAAASIGQPEAVRPLEDSLQRLQRLAAQRQKALVESVCRHEYLAESAELEEWIQEQYVAASSEDYGQDYEHLLILRSKFDELRHRVESGAERFNQCEELAKKLVASESPYIADIERRQEALGEAWHRLVEQMESRTGRLRAAGDIHRFHRDVGELAARALAARPPTARAPPASLALIHAALRDLQQASNDAVAILARIEVLQEEGARLQKLYPGGNVQQIALQQKVLADAQEALQTSIEQTRDQLNMHLQLHQFSAQVRDMMSWSAACRASMSGAGGARDLGSAQAARAAHDALRAEIDARNDIAHVLQLGRDAIAANHPHAQEIEEKCSALIEERQRLLGQWAAQQVALDQLIDLHCFLRDSKQLHELCATQEAALSTEISPTSSVEEVSTQLKKHEAFEKLLATQDEKLQTLNTHGDKLLQQNHVESQRIADELAAINERRLKLHKEAASRRKKLSQALTRAQFTRDAAETRSWIQDKLTLLNSQAHGDVTSLEDKIKLLQKHQAFTAELSAHKAMLQDVEELGQQLMPDAEVEQQLQSLRNDWRRLDEAAAQRGRGLEEAQDILEFNQHLDKIEAWIRDKEMMVQAHELGRDYEHCSALLRKLDDLDSDMKVDDKHVKSICALADKLLQQGPTQQAAGVSSRRDLCVSKWRALSGALQRYKNNLSAALQVHSFNRDVEDTLERISSQSLVFRLPERGRSLSGAQDLRRRHALAVSAAAAVRDRIDECRRQGEARARSHPERASEIAASLERLRVAWEELEQLAERRSQLLDEAIREHKFEEDLKDIEVWVMETCKRMESIVAPETIPQAEELLELHQERKTEIQSRQKTIAALEKEAAQLGADDKLDKLKELSSTLESSWQKTKERLTQAHQLQLFKEQARLTEDWLAGKEAFLKNDDLGENLDAVEALTRKHIEFMKLLDSQVSRVDDLEKFQHCDPEYIRNVQLRRQRLEESCKHRSSMLEQSRQLHEFLRNLNHEREWIAHKTQVANDQNYRELSNLQSKIQKQHAFESELAANKRRIDDVANSGEELIEANHYASQEISKHVEELENEWNELQKAAKLRSERLQQAYQARVFLRGLDDFTSWLDDVETQLLSEDHGKDLASVTALLKRHSRLEQQAQSKADTATQLADTARQLADSDHFMADIMLEKAEIAVKRYRQLQEPMQIRRDNLEDSAHLHRWERDADEEMSWIQEREPMATQTDLGSTLPEAQAMLKKHLALEAELIAREPTVKAVVARAEQLARRGHFARAQLESRAAQLAARLRAASAAAAARAQHLHEHIDLLQLLSEISEAESWLAERRGVLVSSDVGRDQDSVLALMRRLDAHQRELQHGDAAILNLQRAAHKERPAANAELIKKRIGELKDLYEEMKLLSAKRQQRLQQSLKYFKFVQDCSEVQEWIGEQMATAASEEYGLDVEHVENLQQSFDNFYTQLQANEGRIEAVCEAGNVLLEENAPEADRVRQRIDDIRGLWEDLKELAMARHEALAGARQVHEFDRAADETAVWVAEKESALGTDAAAARSLHEAHAARRRLATLHADLHAIRDKHAGLKEEAHRLGAAFPDAREHVTSKLEDVSEALEALAERAQRYQDQLERASHLQAYFGAYQELLAWINETLARVTAPELAPDVAGAERLLARHTDIHTEMQAKEDDFTAFYKDGERLVEEGHFMSSEITSRMETLRSRLGSLQQAWRQRRAVYEQHADALVFLQDALALESWIQARVGVIREEKLGSSVSEAEQLLTEHAELEQSIHAHQEKFNALHRITLVEKAFKEQQESEENARRESANRQEQERLEQYRRREIIKINEERRREQNLREKERSPPTTAVNSSEEILSPAPQFDRLPRAEGVKRAESMSVSKTPKRTPSFTTRRRTQSFRRHRLDGALPPTEMAGYVDRKQQAGVGGKRATVRSWRNYYAVLCGQLLCFFRDEPDFASSKAAAPPVAILNAKCEPARDYTKRAHVFRLACTDGAEYLFACSSQDVMQEWVVKLSFHACLPPELQLTPYGTTPQSPSTLHETASASSSAASSPEPARRSQADILREHRADTARHIESTVLPSLPPRQPVIQEDSADVVLRNQDQHGWGRSRFSNGRDVNSEFIASQRDAYGVNNRPASVAGSGGSPALDQRPASRSSGESELSVSGVTKEKKDKKGVFGGLFSRKKRPQSHM